MKKVLCLLLIASMTLTCFMFNFNASAENILSKSDQEIIKGSTPIDAVDANLINRFSIAFYYSFY